MAFAFYVLRSWLGLSSAVSPQVELTQFILILCLLAAEIIKSGKKKMHKIILLTYLQRCFHYAASMIV